MKDPNLYLVDKENQPGKDQFVEEDDLRFAGWHLLIEFWGAENLNDVPIIEAALRRGSEMAGATLLDIHVHKFSPTGVTGIAVLEESHISIHTWPELGLAAIDIFMCGNCQPYAAMNPLKEALEPDKVMLSEHRRGIIS
jgi:S-adenosylmethionine decarboxylase